MMSYLVNLLLAVLLAGTGGYMVVINRRLMALRSGQSEINGLIDQFTRSVNETDASIKRLSGTAVEIAAQLGEAVDRGRGMQEEVNLLLGSCERAAARLDGSLQHARRLLRRLDEGIAARPAGAAAAVPATPPAPQPRSQATRLGRLAIVDEEAGGEPSLVGTAAAREEDADAEPRFHAIGPSDLAAATTAARDDRSDDAGAPPSPKKAVDDFYAGLRTVKRKARR